MSTERCHLLLLLSLLRLPVTFIVEFSPKSMFEDAINKAISGVVPSAGRAPNAMSRLDSVEYMKMKSDDDLSTPIEKGGSSKRKIHTYENVALPPAGPKKHGRDPIYINVATKVCVAQAPECKHVSALAKSNTKINLTAPPPRSHRWDYLCDSPCSEVSLRFSATLKKS